MGPVSNNSGGLPIFVRLVRDASCVPIKATRVIGLGRAKRHRTLNDNFKGEYFE